MRNSIIHTSIRSFMISVFVMLGIGVGMIGIVLIFAILSKATDKELSISNDFKPTIIANGNNVRKKLSSSAPVILKVNIDGLIGSETLNMYTVRQLLTESREGVLKKNRVKAVLVHISSPGGTVVDSDGIYRALKEYKERYKVPVYAYVDGLCASGGMYVASAVDKVFASNVSLIGSVGVLLPPFFNVTNLMEKIGVESASISAGKGKDAMNPFRKWTPDEQESYKKLTDYFYDEFVDIVTSNRPKVDKTKLVKDYGAHLFPASEALSIGLIDKTDISLEETINELALSLDIKDNFYQVVELEPELWLKSLLSQKSPLLTGKVKHQFGVTSELPERMNNQILYLYLP